MGTWRFRWLFLVAAMSTPLAAHAADLAPGRWKLDAGGQTLMILDLRAPATKAGSWTGSLTSPEHFNFSAGVPIIFSDVHGAVKTKAIVDAHALPDRLEFMIAGDEDRTTYIWRPGDAGNGELLFKGFDIPPQPFTTAPGAAVVADAWDPDQSYAVANHRQSNSEMKAIFAADQAARQSGLDIDWSVVGPEDIARRARTKALLDSGALQSGEDFWRAAFIFQHGSDPQDYLLAHTLALIAAARGRPDATWIAAATLDRYLQRVGQKQIYGTQFGSSKSEPVTQEPYDRTLISDALRSSLGVPSLAAQEQQRKEFQKKSKSGAATD